MNTQMPRLRPITCLPNTIKDALKNGWGCVTIERRGSDAGESYRSSYRNIYGIIQADLIGLTPELSLENLDLKLQELESNENSKG